MNLYREVTEKEIEDEILLMYNKARIWEYEDQYYAGCAIRQKSRIEAKKEIRKYFRDTAECVYFYNRIKKLYRALGEIRAGRKIYTDLLREDD